MPKHKRWSGKQIIVGIIILLAVIGTGYIIFSPDETAPTEGKHITFSGTDLKEEKDGKLIWSVTAKKIEVDPTTQALTLIEPKGEFHQGNIVLTITAPKGHMTGNHDTMELSGGVKATSTDGATFTTKDVVFDSKKHLFHTKGAFEYTNNEVILTGDSLTGNTVLEEVTVSGHAKLMKR